MHDRKPTTKELLDNSSILHRVPNYHRLAITEAVSIELRKPKLNVQREFDLVLPSCRKRDREPHANQEDSSQPILNQNPSDAPQPADAGEGEGGDGTGVGMVEHQQGNPQTTNYVRLRLRPRTRRGTQGYK